MADAFLISGENGSPQKARREALRSGTGAQGGMGVLGDVAYLDAAAGHLTMLTRQCDVAGRSQSVPSGGTRSTAEAGRPCQGSSVATTWPRLPTSEPP